MGKLMPAGYRVKRQRAKGVTNMWIKHKRLSELEKLKKIAESEVVSVHSRNGSFQEFSVLSKVFTPKMAHWMRENQYYVFGVRDNDVGLLEIMVTKFAGEAYPDEIGN